MIKNNDRLIYRMYCINIRHLSGVNKAVQANHSSVEYVWKYKNEKYLEHYINEDKTTIMVDGGTHQDMCDIQQTLKTAGINHTYFIEPDLNNCMTAITLVADERVWDRENYMSYKDFVDMQMIEDGKDPIFSSIRPGYLNEWYEYIGGEKNHILIELLKNKKLSI